MDVSQNAQQTLIDAIDSGSTANSNLELTIELKSMELDGLPVGVHDFLSVKLGVDGGEPQELLQVHGLSAYKDPETGEIELGTVRGVIEGGDKLVVIPSKPEHWSGIKEVGGETIFSTTDPNMIAAKMEILNEAVNRINDKGLDYNPLLQNSNSVARSLAELVVDDPNNVPDIKGIEVGNQKNVLSPEEQASIKLGVYNTPLSEVDNNDAFNSLLNADADKIVSGVFESDAKAKVMEGMGEPDVAGDAGLAARAAEQVGAAPEVVADIAPAPEVAPAIAPNAPEVQQQGPVTPEVSSPSLDFAY